METSVIMKRSLFNKEISQNSKTGFFSATDLVKAGNMWRLQNDLDQFKFQSWATTKGAKEFIARLENEYGKVIITSRGKGSHTWVHPFIFLDIALSISPELKIEVYSWLYDELIKHRNSSGDSYKKMTGALYQNYGNKREFPFMIKDVANKIKKACRVSDWEHASEDQLKMRDKIHDNISLLCDVLRNNEKAVEIAILRATELKEK